MPVRTYQIAIVVRPARKGYDLRAYVRIPGRPTSPGSCLHTISASRSLDAKAGALAEHLNSCLRQATNQGDPKRTLMERKAR